MKKMVLFTTTALLLVFASCSKTQNCHCSYVGESNTPAAGQMKTEDTKVSNKVAVDAFGQCSDLESKYWASDFQGTCVLQ